MSLWKNGVKVTPGARPSTEIIVDPSGGGDYTTIKAALQNAATRTCIIVYPGIYQEDNPLTPAAERVTLKACAGPSETRIEALNANQDMFISNNSFDVRGFSLSNVSGTGWVINITTDHNVEFRDCAVFACEQGFRLNHASGILGLDNVNYIPSAAVTLAIAARVNAGTMNVHRGVVGGIGSVTTIFDVDGAAAILNLDLFRTVSANVGTAITLDNAASGSVRSVSLYLMNDGIVLGGGASLVVFASIIANATQDNVRIDNTGSGTTVSGQAFVLANAGRYDLNVLSATASALGFGFLRPDQLNAVAGAQIIGSATSDKEDDEGVDIYGELHVGSPEIPSESVFGGGDSYTRGMLVYTYNPSGAVWTDVSAAARSASGSTFTFPAVAINNAIYVASSLSDGTDVLQHFGIKLSQTVAAVLGAGSIVVEYWNGASWIAIDHMSTLSSSPWTQYAKNLFLRTGSEQLRYEEAFLSSWTKNDPGMGLGTNYYWVRYRIASGITTAPVFQQFKLHTNRTEINTDGVVEFFGAARPERELITHIQISSAVVGSAPANASVAFTATTTLSLTRNQFNDNQVHSFGQLLTIPTGLDTSIPVTVENVWYPDTANAGDVEIRVVPGQLAVGDLFDGSIADGATLADVNTVAAGSRYQSRLSSFDVDVSTLVPGDFLVIRVERDATAGNDPPDTLAGNIVNAEFRAFGRAWRA